MTAKIIALPSTSPGLLVQSKYPGLILPANLSPNSLSSLTIIPSRGDYVSAQGKSTENCLFYLIARPIVMPMARITVEDCLGNVTSRFDLVKLASIRAKQLLKGAKPLVSADNREIVIALREIAEGKVRWAPRTLLIPEAKTS